MPGFIKKIRRFSSGIQAKSRGRKQNATGNVDSLEELDTRDAVVRPTRRLMLEPADYGPPPPAYSFVESSEGDEEQDVGREEESGADEQDDGDNGIQADAVSVTNVTTVSANTTESQLANTTTIPPPPSTTPSWLSQPKTFTASQFTRLPTEIWLQIAQHLSLSSSANLTLTSRHLAHSIGPPIWRALSHPSQTAERTLFLTPLTPALPNHILCHACGTFHARLAHPPGSERLRSTTAYASTPLTRCPVPLSTYPAGTVRLTNTHSLPYFLAHLATRPHAHGIPTHALTRAWTPDTSAYTTTSLWTHRTLAALEPRTGHLLLRVQSTHSVERGGLSASEVKLVLCSRGDYSANYSTCWHEMRGAGGALFNAARCALGHIPSSAATTGGGSMMGGGGGKGGKGGGAVQMQMPSQCAKCRPLRRCVLCPSEYLVEAKLVEEKKTRRRSSSSLSGDSGIGIGGMADSVKAAAPGPSFKHALTITRWTDLGTVVSPDDAEWAASAAQWQYEDPESKLYTPRLSGKEASMTVRQRFEIATGSVRESSVKAVPLRRASHWASAGHVVVRGKERFVDGMNEMAERPGEVVGVWKGERRG